MATVWTETTVAVARAHAESVASFLLDLGSPGLVTEEGEHEVTLTAYLAADAEVQLTALRVFCAELAAMTPELPLARIQARALQQEDWAHNWMDHFPPLAIGERLYIAPPWVADIPAGRIAIVIDPGLAFGTGHHETTQGCLTLLERFVSTSPIRRALDVGTGSGILAIALAKLGVGEVWAVDVDPEACRAARENCARNAVAGQVHVAGDMRAATGRFELITANLLSSLLIELAHRLAAALATDGYLIASGILVSEAPAVVAAFTAQHLRECTRATAGEWVTLAFAATIP